MTTAPSIVERLAPSNPLAVRRHAFYLSADEGPLFAWLHAHVSEPSYDHGVVLCAPLGYEQIYAHRSLRHLADALAERRIPVLRFDWHGTGDSSGDDEEPNRIETWSADVGQAIAWMQGELGCQRVSVIAVRAGALVASQAIGQHEIENLVLWAPVMHGRAYVREMTLIARSGYASSSEAGDGIEAGGNRMTAATAADLSQLQLLRLQPKCQRALVVSRDDVAPDARLGDYLSQSGIVVDQMIVPGYTGMMAEPHLGQVPTEAILAMAGWLEYQITSKPTGTLRIDTSMLGPFSAVMTADSGATSSAEVICETAWRISADPNLFGIVSEPAALPEHDLPTIVLLNAGSTYRAGPGRLSVFLARELAALGYRTLRVDVRGLGDSILEDEKCENDCYPATAFDDMQRVIKALEVRYGVRRVVLMGLCSGAYVAFQATAQFTTPTLVESVLVNPLTYFWAEGMQVDDVMSQQHLRDHYSMSSVMQWRKWVKFLSGQTRLTPCGAIKLVAQRVGHRLTKLQSSRAHRDTLPTCRKPSHPTSDDLPRDLEWIAARGRTLAMFVSTTDPGYVILKYHAARQAKRLMKADKLRVSFISDADHTFSRRTSRQSLLEAIVGHLRSRFG